jgi:hypothetical protein
MMAGEITLHWIMSVNNPAAGTGVTGGKTPPQQTINQAAQGKQSAVQSIPTTAAGTAIGLGNIATLGLSWFKNLDATNYLELGVQVAGTFYPLVRLNAGETYPFRFAQGITPYARANTATVKLEYEINEN